MGSRYVVRPTPDMCAFGIVDRVLYAYCGLPDEDGNVIPLQWALYEGAEHWLTRCYRTWPRWEPGRAPHAWQPLPVEPAVFRADSYYD